MAPDQSLHTLTPTQRKFIDFWGEMASQWGVSRTMAQVYALLFISAEPLHTDEIMAQLNISRGNANMNLHKLMDWGLVEKVLRTDTRKDFFIGIKSPTVLTHLVITQRWELEMAPVMQHLKDFAAEARADKLPDSPLRQEENQLFVAHLEEMQVFMEQVFQVIQILLKMLENRNTTELQSVLSMFAEQFSHLSSTPITVAK
jgi:DNA-binding transcriptional regulator GbsR (MarR family)